MKVIVKARHMSLTPALREHAEEKLGNHMMRIFDSPAATVEIELSDLGKAKDGKDKECRITVTMPKANTIVISEIENDMYKAIDLAQDRLLHQVKRERGRRNDTSKRQKSAQKHRLETARASLTVPREQWEKEVMEYERSHG